MWPTTSRPICSGATTATGSCARVGAISGVAYNADGKAQAGMGVDFGDYDGDGDQDFYVTNFSADVNTLYRNDGKGMFADATAAAGLDGPVRPFVVGARPSWTRTTTAGRTCSWPTATSTRSWRSSRPRCATGSATSSTGITGQVRAGG